MADIIVDEKNLSVIGVMTPFEFEVIKRVIDTEGTTRLVQLFASFISQNSTVQREQDVARVKQFVESAPDDKLAAMVEIATNRVSRSLKAEVL